MTEREPFGDAPDDPDKPAAGRHRAPATSQQRVIYRVVAPLTAVVVVAAAVVVLIVLRGHSSGSGPGAGVITAPTATSLVTPPTSTAVAPSASRSVAPTLPPTQAPPRRPQRRPASRTAMDPVRVYNNTRITGLAHHVADVIAQRGWTVPVVGNITGTTPVTTLYYSPSARPAAQHLAREFSGIRRLLPNGAQRIHYHGLTLVLTADWHD